MTPNKQIIRRLPSGAYIVSPPDVDHDIYYPPGSAKPTLPVRKVREEEDWKGWTR